MNIVFVSKECPPSPRSCGIGTYVWETGRALAQRGHRITIVAASDDGQLTLSAPLPNVNIVRLPDDELGIESRNILARAFCAPREKGTTYRKRVAECISTLVKTERPDVIEFPGFRGESVMWLTTLRSVPMVVRMHGFTAGTDAAWKDYVSATRRLRAKWEREEFEAADVVTVVSEHEASSVRSRLDTDRVKVVHNSIDAEHWRKLAANSSKEIGPSDILFVGSLLSKKGVFALLQAASRLRQTGWRGRLMLAGRTSSEFERHVRLLAAVGKKLPDWVVRLGVCPRECLAGLYRDTGVCCFPSLIDPFSYTCLEAMACGGIVVGSLRTGMAEMLTESSGFLVQPGDISGLVATLKSALSMSGGERRRMKDAAQQRVRDSFDNSVIIPKLLAVYSEIAN